MQQTLAWSTDSIVLIWGWTTSSLLSLSVAMVTSCICAVIYEYLRHSLSVWDRKTHYVTNSFQSVLLRVYRSSLHFASATLSYVIMLFLMTYNLWIVTSALLGAGLGFYIVGPWIAGPVRYIKEHKDESNSYQVDLLQGHTKDTPTLDLHAESAILLTCDDRSDVTQLQPP